MTGNNRYCYACRNLRRYYTKGNTQYNKTSLGWCGEKKDIVSVKDTCDKFVYRSSRSVMRMGVQRYLNDLLMQLSAIRCIVEEEANEPSE